MRAMIAITLAAWLPLAALADGVLFTEDFESPVVTGYEEGQSPGGWVRANQGFGGTRHGLDNKDGGDWDTAGIYTNNEQVYSFRYTNSGLTTDSNTVGRLDRYYATYTVSFDVIPNKNIDTPTYTSATGTAYNVQLLAYPIGSTDRNDARNNGDAVELNSLSGTVATNDVFSSFSFSYTTDPATDDDARGYDLAVRLKGQTSGACIDNVRVEYVQGARKQYVIRGNSLRRVGSLAVATSQKYWTPAEIATVAWYDAQDNSTITETGGAVSQWDDKSGNGNDLTQGTGSFQPQTGSRMINGYNALDFDGSDDRMNIPSIDVISNGMWYVAELDAFGASGRSVLLGGGGNNQSSATDNSLMRIWQSSNPYSGDTKGPAIAVSNAYVLGFLAYDTKAYSKDGTLTTTSDSYNTGTMIPTTLARGQFDDWDGTIGEMLIVSEAVGSTDVRQKLEGYLAWKWGLESSLPTNHPYANNRPTL